MFTANERTKKMGEKKRKETKRKENIKKIYKKKKKWILREFDGFTWKRQEGSDLMDTRIMEFRRGF